MSEDSKREQSLLNKHQQDNTKAAPTSSQEGNVGVGSLWKKYVFYINDGAHAQFLVKLRYDNIKQQQFFKMIINAYLEDHPSIRDLILDINSKKLSKANKKKMIKEQKQKQEVIKDFALNEDEIESIFDAIEKENPDL